MLAFTRYFHIFASGVTTGFSAVFFSNWYFAQTRYVCALLGLLIRHYDSILFKSIFRSLQHCDSCIQISKPTSPLARVF